MSRLLSIPAHRPIGAAPCEAFARAAALIACMVRTDDYDADDEWENEDDFQADDDDDDLMVCPSCGGAVHEQTQQCPHCGDYITPAYPGGGLRRWVVGAIALALAASMLLWLVL